MSIQIDQKICRQWAPVIGAIARSVIRQRPAAWRGSQDDLAQIGMAALLVAIPLIDQAMEPRQTEFWLRQRIVGAMRDATSGAKYREAQHVPLVVEMRTPSSPHPEAAIVEEMDTARWIARIAPAVAALTSARQRRVIELRYLGSEVLTQRAVGELLGISQVAVGYLERRALQHLRAWLLDSQPRKVA